MINILNQFWNDESGLGTVEIILIMSVLVAVALLFGKSLMGWVVGILGKVFDIDIPWLDD